MKNKIIAGAILFIVFLAVTFNLTYYHAFNFSEYTTRKGDGETMFVTWILISTLIYFLLFYLITGSYNFYIGFVFPFLNIIAAVFLTILLSSILDVPGYPRNLMFEFYAVYMSANLILTIFLFKKIRNKSIQKT